MIALGVCPVAIVALAVGHRPPYGVSDPRVTSGTHYQATPALDVVPYTLVYLGYLAWVLYQVGLTAHRNRAVSGAGPPLIALGVRTITAGAALGIGYAVTKAIATTAATHPPPTRQTTPPPPGHPGHGPPTPPTRSPGSRTSPEPCTTSHRSRSPGTSKAPARLHADPG
jgi:hypothetical protein